MRSRLLVLFAAAVLPLAGCGDSSSTSSGPGIDPAAVVPATTPLYLEAVVRPDGDVGDGVKDALGKLLRTDEPGKKVRDLFDKLAASGGLKWDDFEQWLDKRIGIFITSFAADQVSGALVAGVTDGDKAKEMFKRLAERGKAGELKTEDYKGVEITSDDKAFGYAVFDDYATIGTVAGVKQVIDTAKGGRPLTDVPDYTATRDAVKADDGLGLAYVEPQGLVDAISEAAGALPDNPLSNPQMLRVIRQVLAKAGRAVGVSLHADGNAIRMDAAAIGGPAAASGGAATDALAALPADAWLALGLGDIGKALKNAVGQLGQLAALNGSMPDLQGVLQNFKDKTGIDPEEDFLNWMGDGAVYARGRTLADIGGVLTIATKDPAKSRKAVGILARVFASSNPGAVSEATVQGYDTAVEIRPSALPISIFVAANDERFSVGVNPKALTDVNDPAETLGDSSTYKRAAEALGEGLEPVFILDTPTIIGLVESFGIGEREDYKMVKPYLDVLGTLSVGTVRDGDVSRFAVALGLR